MAASGPSPRELIGLGASVAGSVILGLAVGFALDKLCETSPALLFIGLAVGVVTAVALTALQVRRFATAESSDSEQPKEAPNCKETLH